MKKETAVGRCYAQTQDQVTSPLPDKSHIPVEIAVTFDGTWDTRGWSTNDGIVDFGFKETGKVIDVVIIKLDCPQCKRIEEE